MARFQQQVETTQSGASSSPSIESSTSDVQITGVSGYKYAYDDIGGSLDYSSGHVVSYAASGDNAIENTDQDSPSSDLDVPSGGVGY